MKQYEIQTVLSDGSRLCDPAIEAKDLEALKKVIAEKRAVVEEEVLEMYPGETIVAIEIYEKVKVGAVGVKPKVLMGKDGQCKICHRLHDLDQPCPLRIANAYTMQAGALERLTKIDKIWMQVHPDFSVLDIVEDAVVEAMPVYPVSM